MRGIGAGVPQKRRVSLYTLKRTQAQGGSSGCDTACTSCGCMGGTARPMRREGHPSARAQRPSCAHGCPYDTVCRATMASGFESRMRRRERDAQGSSNPGDGAPGTSAGRAAPCYRGRDGVGDDCAVVLEASWRHGFRARMGPWCRFRARIRPRIRRCAMHRCTRLRCRAPPRCRRRGRLRRQDRSRSQFHARALRAAKYLPVPGLRTAPYLRVGADCAVPAYGHENLLLNVPDAVLSSADARADTHGDALGGPAYASVPALAGPAPCVDHAAGEAVRFALARSGGCKGPVRD